MLLVLSWEEPKWRVYGVEPEIEGEGDSIDEAFAAFYNALAGDGGAHVEVVHDFNAPHPGIYRIQLKQRPDGGLNAISQDILGLSLGGPDAEAVMLALPEKISELLSKQDHHSKHV